MDWVSHTRSVSRSRRLSVSVTEWLMSDDWQWLLSDTHSTDWLSNWILILSQWLSQWVSDSLWATVSQLCFDHAFWYSHDKIITLLFTSPVFGDLGLLAPAHDQNSPGFVLPAFVYISELIKRCAVKLSHRIMVSIDSIRGVIVTYLSRHHSPCHVVVHTPLQLASVFSM